ncbi:hypothetical protein NKDENANG_03585 [Candidatus Entotheonellaceae bacterium PAL068K]
MTNILAWLHVHEAALWWLGAVSLATFVGTLIVIPFLVIRIPVDYFTRGKRYAARDHSQSVVRHTLGLLLKNLLGFLFIGAGLVMLVLPGQGIITILIGLMLMNFPGKYALERCIVQQPAVFRTINWMRERVDQPGLELPTAHVPVDDLNEKN